MILAIDAGNTRIKWGLFDTNGTLQSADACFHDAIPSISLSAPSEITKVIISNVAGESIGAALKTKLAHLLDNKHVTIDWLSSEVQTGTLNNGYSQPKTLGTDRWAAMVGAWEHVQASCVVVNLGTTITIDLIHAAHEHKATFIGGTIMPGIYMMANSLNANTAQLPRIQMHLSSKEEHADLDRHTIGCNTLDAIAHGILNAATGAILQAVHTLAKISQSKPMVVMSGGDSGPIAAQLQQVNIENNVIKEMHINDNLVLLGLFYLSHAQNH